MPQKVKVTTEDGKSVIVTLADETEPAAAARAGRSWVDTAAEWMPAAGGAIGAVAGNLPGAMLGAAAGEAYKQLVQRARGTRRDISTVTDDATLKAVAD